MTLLGVEDIFLEATRTLRTGSDVSETFEFDAVVGLMKAGTALLLLLTGDAEDGGFRRVKLPIAAYDVGLDGADLGEDNLSKVLGVEFLGVVLAAVNLLLPELDLDKFSFELPESPRLTLAEL